MIKRVEFVSYDGEYPNLCAGILILKIYGREVIFPEYCLSSGGAVTFDDNWIENVLEGEWDVSKWPEYFPEELKDEVLEVINDNIDFGCCGGCV